MHTSIENIIAKNTGKLYKEIIQNVELDSSYPHKTFESIWSEYEKGTTTNNMNGHILEYSICEIFKQYNVGVLYFQCTFWGMPHDRFDIGGWTKQQYPIIISCKTSLRERWKQADMEGRLLKGIFPKAQSYLITNNPIEAKTQRKRIKDGTSQGIDGVYVAHEEDFDEFIKYLQGMDLVVCDQITPLTGTIV